jgi:serine protease Do
VLEVVERGPAAGAGIEAGDILVALDDTALVTLGELQRALGEERIGQRTTVTLIRRGERITVELAPVEAL